MALPSSGPISISEVLTELGLDSQQPDTRLRALESGDYEAINNNSSNKPNGSSPHALSEWYSYDHSASPAYSNDYYYTNDGVNDYIKGAWSGYTTLHNVDWSISFWVRQNQSSGASQQLWDWNANSTLNSGNTNNRLFFTYNNNFNRFIVRLRTNSTNFDRQWGLHDNNSATGTGTNSGVKWTSSNRGNVNSDGFCHIAITFDGSQSSAANAFKIYWNGSELTSQAVANSGTKTSTTFASLSIGAAQHNTTSGNSNVDIDEWAFYKDILTSSEVSTLYNSGTIVSPHTLLTNNLHEVVQFGASNSINTYNSNYSGTISGGSTNTYA
jgi:hypothetical protein